MKTYDEFLLFIDEYVAAAFHAELMESDYLFDQKRKELEDELKKLYRKDTE